MLRFGWTLLLVVAATACFSDEPPIVGKAPGLDMKADKKGGEGAAQKRSKPLGPPWSEMRLPVENAHVMSATDQQLMLGFPEAAPSADQWKTALTEAGWVLSESGEQTEEGQAFLFSRGEDQLGMAIGIEDGATVVFIEEVNANSAKPVVQHHEEAPHKEVGDKDKPVPPKAP